MNKMLFCHCYSVKFVLTLQTGGKRGGKKARGRRGGDTESENGGEPVTMFEIVRQGKGALQV